MVDPAPSAFPWVLSGMFTCTPALSGMFAHAFPQVAPLSIVNSIPLNNIPLNNIPLNVGTPRRPHPHHRCATAAGEDFLILP